MTSPVAKFSNDISRYAHAFASIRCPTLLAFGSRLMPYRAVLAIDECRYRIGALNTSPILPGYIALPVYSRQQ